LKGICFDLDLNWDFNSDLERDMNFFSLFWILLWNLDFIVASSDFSAFELLVDLEIFRD